MALSTRWHESSCTTPQVVVNSSVPECRSCGSNASALLRRAAEEPAPSYSGINLPPETPIGQMDLWWPPCVPYTCNGVRRPRPEVSSGNTACLTPQASASESSLSEIYTSTLGRDHFRLLYLSGAKAIDSPIHGSLVEYPRDNCPEYETTSYTWGGEDGDATPCKPAFFGEFWDVLFLTRNCWSLLQYLRPTMGTRVVWVDAICINQNNIPERGAQVSSMPQIYRNCMRVVIYPGDHLVCKEQDRFRQQIRHDDVLEHDDADTVDDNGLDVWGSVLQSRYISRVWIIQELILAPSAVLALRNHDLYLSNTFLHTVSRAEDKRKWLEFMGQDHRLRKTTLIEGLQKTHESQATDPRDRIFGILGILWGNAAYSEIVPDYSISMRDCVIGAMGLTLLVSKEIWPLLYAPTSHSTSGYPSWVPNLDDLATWTYEAPERRGWEDRPIPEVPGEWNTAIGLFGYPLYRFAQSLGPGGSVLDVGSDTIWCQDACIDSVSGALTLQLVRVFDKPHRITRVDAQYDGCLFAVEGSSAAARFCSKKPPQKPEQPCYIFLAFDVGGASPKEGVLPIPVRLSTSYPYETETYVILATEADISGAFTMVQCFPIDYLVCLSASPPPLPQPPTRFSSLELADDYQLMSLFEVVHWTLNYSTREEFLAPRRYSSKHPDKTHISHSWDDAQALGSEAMLFDMIIPGGGDAASGLLQLSLSAGRSGPASDPVTVTEEFRRAYAHCLQTAAAEFNPVLDEENVWFTMADDDALSHYWSSLTKRIADAMPYREAGADLNGWAGKTSQWMPWDLLFPPWFDLQIPGVGNTSFNVQNCKLSKVWQPRLEEEEPYGAETLRSDRCALHEELESQDNLDLKYWLPCATEPRGIQMPVRAKMPLIEIVKAIRSTGWNRIHRHLLAFSEKYSESVETIMSRGMQPEGRNMYLYDWPEALVEELGFVWRKESVTFV